MVVAKRRTDKKRSSSHDRAEDSDQLPGIERKSEIRELAMLLGNRLVEQLSIAEPGLKPHQVSQWLANITGASRSSAATWKTGSTLPDLLSFKRLVDGVNIDAYYLLGLSDKAKSAIPMWKGSREEKIQLRRMVGDEMSRLIEDGQLMTVDLSVTKVAGSGIYILQDKKQEFVRRIEKKPTVGLAMTCENQSYEAMAFSSESQMKAKGLQIVGKVVGVVKGV